MRTYHLPDIEITTRGDVPLSMYVSVYACRHGSGRWNIEQVRVNRGDEGGSGVVLWFSKDQGYDCDLIRPRLAHLMPIHDVEHFLKNYIPTQPLVWERICARARQMEERGLFQVVC